MNKFEENDFTIQVIAKGSFVDNGTGDGNSYIVETFAIRLNHVALNAWILSETFNCRECYDTDEEWNTHKAEYKAKREAWNISIIETLEIDPNTGSISITQSQTEVFTVVHIQRIGNTNKITKESNPWMPSNEAQKQWITKWTHEQKTCQTCSKQAQCTVADRQDKNICQLLRERS